MTVAVPEGGALTLTVSEPTAWTGGVEDPPLPPQEARAVNRKETTRSRRWSLFIRKIGGTARERTLRQIEDRGREPVGSNLSSASKRLQYLASCATFRQEMHGDYMSLGKEEIGEAS